MADASDSADSEDTDTDTVTYQFEPDAKVWEAWKATIPHSTTIYERLEKLLREDYKGFVIENDDETITCQFEANADAWREWTDTIPRSTPVYRRLEQLIKQDLRATQHDGNSDMEVASVSVLASRIRIRSMQALGAVRDGEEVDTEMAIEQLEDVIELAHTLES